MKRIIIIGLLMSVLTNCHKEVKVSCEEVPNSGKMYKCDLHLIEEGNFLVTLQDGNFASPLPVEIINECADSCILHIDQKKVVTLYVWGGSETPLLIVDRIKDK